MTYDTTAGLRRRRDAALRCPPLPTGHRDPDGPQTDAPDPDAIHRDSLRILQEANYHQQQDAQLSCLRTAWKDAGIIQDAADRYEVRRRIQQRADEIQGGAA